MDSKEHIISRFQHLKEICMFIWDASEVEKIEKAFHFAYKIVGDNQFKTGETIIIHSLDVATIIAQEIGLGPDSIISGLLHNVTYTELAEKAFPEVIEKEFGQHIYSILNGMAKINALGTDTVDIHSENYRKLLLALAGDVRVIIIKIADRLQVLRNL